MSALSMNQFFNMGRIGADAADLTQKSQMNNRYSDYCVTNYFLDDPKRDHVHFATSQPNIMNNANNGINPGVIDTESHLLLKREQERNLEKLHLMQRPFLTVPYLGRGTVDPVIESQLMQGEMVSQFKSTSTIMDKSFMDYRMIPEEASKPDLRRVEEDGLDWTRGGILSREMAIDGTFIQSRPANKL